MCLLLAQLVLLIPQSLYYSSLSTSFHFSYVFSASPLENSMSSPRIVQWYGRQALITATEFVKFRCTRASGVMRGSSGMLHASVITLIAVAGSQRVDNAHKTSSMLERIDIVIDDDHEAR